MECWGQRLGQQSPSWLEGNHLRIAPEVEISSTKRLDKPEEMLGLEMNRQSQVIELLCHLTKLALQTETEVCPPVKFENPSHGGANC